MPGIPSGPAFLFALGLALAWVTGMRAYLAAFAVGLAGAKGWIALPGALHALASPWAIGALGSLAVVEFAVDKVPGLDGVWDLLNSLVRIPAGAGLGAAFMARDGAVEGRSLLVAGAAALCAHAIKTATRRRINSSPEPLSNWGASLAEDLACALALVLAFAHPFAALAVAGGGLLAIAVVALRSFPAPRPSVGAAA